MASALTYLYNNNAGLKGFLAEEYFLFQNFGASTGLYTKGPFYGMKGKSPTGYCMIDVGSGYVDLIKNTPNLTYAFVLYDILHEFIHVKEYLGLDYNGNRNHLITYINTFNLRGILEQKENAYEQNLHFGSLFRNYFFNSTTAGRKGGLTKEYSQKLINGYKTFLEAYLNTLPDNTRANYKQEVYDKLGIKLNVK